MPKRTLLDMTQRILDSMGSDEVNSIDDTEEAHSVASIIRDVYYEILGSRLWPTHAQISKLVAMGNTNYPTHMKLPDNTIGIDWIQYNYKEEMSDATGLEEFTDIDYLTPAEFLQRLDMRNPSDSYIQVVIDNLSNNGLRLNIQNDKMPQFWTSFDDEYIIFDSFDSTYDDTLQNQKTRAALQLEPTFDMSDTFVPDLPAKAFPYLLEEAKSTAFIEIRNVANEKAESKSRRQRTWLARQKHITAGGLKVQTYGRK